jgi:hypothetical protein
MSFVVFMDSTVSVCVLLIFGCVGFTYAWRQLRGTTLRATGLWSLLALSMCSGLLLQRYQNPAYALPESLEFMARVLLLLPVISLLGAKRPQDGPWNFVVFALWCVLITPAALAYCLGQPRLNIPFAWSLMLCVLILLTALNTWGTQFVSGVLVTLAQVIFLRDYLPGSVDPLPNSKLFVAYGMLILAMCWFAFSLRTPRKSTSPLNRLWLDFRSNFGVFWALRVQERMNDAATRYNWPVYLAWSGWHSQQEQPLGPDFELDATTQKAILQTLRGLLRRFVSSEWIEQRLRGGA